MVNHVHGVLKSFGHRAKKYSAPSFHRQVANHVPEELKPALDPILDMLAAVADGIRTFDREIAELTKKQYPETSRLRQVDRVGQLTALRF